MGIIMAVLLGVLSLFLLWTLWGRMAHALQMLQQCHYMNDRFTTWIAGHRLVALPVPLSVLVIAYWVLVVVSFLFPMPGSILTIGTVVIGVLGLGIIKISSGVSKESKKPLKITARVWRIIATGSILMLLIAGLGSFFLGANGLMLLSQIAGWLLTFNLFAYVVMLLANEINKPMENSIRLGFINDARRIVTESPSLDVIGVTGSYGKTSVKNFLYKTLSSQYEVLITPKNYNTTMGVVKTIRENLKPIHQIFICEMGATHVGDIKEICDIVNPKYGIITSVGPQHLESFKSIDNVLKTKFELQEAVAKNDGFMFLNYNNEYIKNKKINSKYFSYGIDDPSLDYNGSNIKSTSSGISFDIAKDKETTHFETSIIGKHNVINLVGAIACANFLGVPYKKMIPKIRELKPVAHRLELINRGNITIIDDSYNSNPVSSKSAIDTLLEFEGTHIIVTPGLIELGSNEDKYNFELGKYAAKCDYIYLVGEKHSKPIYDGAISENFDKNKITVCSSPNEAVLKVNSLNISGKITILLENDLPDNYNLKWFL